MFAVVLFYCLTILSSFSFFSLYIWICELNEILCIFLGIFSGLIFVILIYAIAFFGYIPIAKKASPKNPINYHFIHGLSSLALYFTNVKLKVYNKSNLPKKTNYFLAPNHKSMMDIVTTYNLSPKGTGFVAKQEVLDMPLIKHFFKAMGVVTINRNNDREAAKSLIQAADNLKNGINMCVFPEGGIKSRETDEMVEIKAGSYKIAVKAKVPIVPVSYINNRLLQTNCPKRKTVVYCMVHKPITYEEYKDLNTQEIGEMVFKIVNDGIKELQNKFNK